MPVAGFISFILGALILTAIFVGGAIVLWLVFGRKRYGEDKAIGILEAMSFFKNMTGATNNRMR